MHLRDPFIFLFQISILFFRTSHFPVGLVPVRFIWSCFQLHVNFRLFIFIYQKVKIRHLLAPTSYLKMNPKVNHLKTQTFTTCVKLWVMVTNSEFDLSHVRF
jgi:hypothetical protein